MHMYIVDVGQTKLSLVGSGVDQVKAVLGWLACPLPVSG